jgi:Fe-S cluster assembly protein SufD
MDNRRGGGMNAVVEHSDKVDRYLALAKAASPLLPGVQVEWLVAQRARALDYFGHAGFPTRKQEAWRYTSLDPVLGEAWEIRAGPAAALKAADIERFHMADNAVARLVFVNGRWQRELSSPPGSVPDGIQLAGLRNALEEIPERLETALGGVASQDVSGFSALNTALFEDGVWLQVAAGTRLSGPVEILYLSTGSEKYASHTRNLLVLEDGAEATVVEHYASLDETPCFTNSLTEIRLGQRSDLEHLRLQDESAKARHLGNVFIQQGEESRLRAVGVSLGGLWARCEYHNRLQHTGASCAIDGLYVAGDRRLTDVHLDVDHAIPGCRSRLRFKGILTGRGRAVFDGLIRVRPDAQKTDARLSNDNLVLSRNAEIDTKPQLEIYADDVKCSHGTTVGQLDAGQLFYLRSRGIGADAARRMLCLGFATEVLQGCSVDGFSARIGQRLRHHLESDGYVAGEGHDV